jgi:pyridoxamine 5'-phosphate oxidase
VAELRRADLAEDPLEQFRRWFEEARPVVRLPEAMAVATAAPDGGPSVRMLLLKAADERGFVFFTGYVSRKGAELDANPRAALLFYWELLDALNSPEFDPWTLVDARWTPKTPAGVTSENESDA